MMILKRQNSNPISVIIVNFRSERYLEKCLASVYNWIGSSNVEVIVVNNDQNEKLGRIKELFPEIVLIEADSNLGFGKAVNLGVQKSQTETLLFLNPDAEIKQENSRKVLERLADNKELGIIGARLEDRAGFVQEWIAGREAGLWEIFLNNLGFSRSRQLWKSQREIEADWVSAGTMFIRRDLFLELGGFDENYFMYFEDMDLSKRARNIGKKVLYYPQFKVFHHSGQSYGNDKISQKKHYYDSQEKYFQKHKSKLETKTLRLLRKFLIKREA